MAISVRATSTGSNGFASSESINMPTGTASGDLTIIIGALDGPTTISVPSGWTTAFNFNGQFIFYKLWSGTPASSVTITGTNTHFWGLAAASFIGCDASTPVDVVNSCVSLPANGVGDSFGKNFYNAPSVNPNWNNDLLLSCFMDGNGGGGGTITFPSGFSNVVTQAPGPNVAIGSKQVSSAASTGNQMASWHSDNNALNIGVMIALHASGDTAATPASANVTWGAVATTISISFPYSVQLAEVNAQQNDLICLWVTANNGVTVTTPTGYTAQTSGGNGNYLFTRSYQSGDADPSIALSGGATGIIAAIALRTSGAVATPSVDQVNSQLGSGTPSSATLSTLTPATATEYLIAAWGQVSGSTNTWTPSGSLTTQLTSGYGPSCVIMDTQPASNPTGTFTTQSSLNTAIFASELLVKTGVAPASTGGVFFSSIT